MGKRGRPIDPNRRFLSIRFRNAIRVYCDRYCQAQYKLAIEIDMHPDTFSLFMAGKLKAIPGHPKLDKLASIISFHGQKYEGDYEQANQVSYKRGAVSGGTAAMRTDQGDGARAPRRGNIGTGKNRTRVPAGDSKI